MAQSLVVTGILGRLRMREREIDREIGPMMRELDELRAAIRRIQGITVPVASPEHEASAPHRGRGVGRDRAARAPRGRNGTQILAAIADRPKTASEVSRETGIPVATASSTLSTLVRTGRAVKAARGYSAAKPRSSESDAAQAPSGQASNERAPHGANVRAILDVVRERPGVSVAEIVSVTRIVSETVAPTVSRLKREGVLVDEAGGVKLAAREPVTLTSSRLEAFQGTDPRLRQ